MITIFTVPKQFEGLFDTIQRNAILSWKQLRPAPEIILLGKEYGVQQAAAEFGVRHIAQIQENEFGTPLVRSAFKLAKEQAQNDLLVYADCDVILMQDFMEAVARVDLPMFLMASQRWNLEIRELLDFTNNYWTETLRAQLKAGGELQSKAAMDYFVFPKKLEPGFPDFVIGRKGWDDWFLFHLTQLGIPIIDASPVVQAIHQKHDYSHVRKEGQYAKETKENIGMLGGFSHTFTLRDADFLLTKEGIKKNRKSNALLRTATSFLNVYPYFHPVGKFFLSPAWLLLQGVRIAKHAHKKYLIL